MPTYQYACTMCDHRFEKVQRFTEASLTVCPECGHALRKVYGSVGVVFKGSGFYRTDSRSGPVAPVPAGEKSGSDHHKKDGTSESATKTPVTAGASAGPAKSESGSASSKSSSSSVAPARAAAS